MTNSVYPFEYNGNQKIKRYGKNLTDMLAMTEDSDMREVIQKNRSGINGKYM